jgi:hypothetical protein
LVDAHGVNPEPILDVESSRQAEKMPQVVTHLERLLVDQDSVIWLGFAPGV